MIQSDERQRIAMHPDHDPDQPLLREGPLGAGSSGHRIRGAGPPPGDPLVPVRRAGGKKTAPVLVCGDRVFADSADIVEEAERAGAARTAACSPTTPSAAAEVRGAAARLRHRLGPQGRRWMYYGLRGRRDIAIAYACTGVPPGSAARCRLLYPLVARIIDRYLDVTPATAAAAETEVRGSSTGSPSAWRAAAPTSAASASAPPT